MGLGRWEAWNWSCDLSRHGKCHFLYTIPILRKINLPQQVGGFWQYQICNKAAKAKKTIINAKSFKYTKSTLNVTFLTYPRPFTKKCKIWTTNGNYDKILYVQLQILPQPSKLYNIPDGVDGDIFQVWPSGSMRGTEKNCIRWHNQTNRRTDMATL